MHNIIIDILILYTPKYFAWNFTKQGLCGKSVLNFLFQQQLPGLAIHHTLVV